jgi:hypothetical protein
MLIYRMHIANFHNCTINSSILQTCRGIYAELHKEMRSGMINAALESTDLVIKNDRMTWNDNVRVWQLNEQIETRFGLCYRDISRLYYVEISNTWHHKNYRDQIPSPQLLGTLLTFSIRLELSRKYDAESLYQMLEQISKELVHVHQIRISSRWINEEQKSLMYRVLTIFITLPTVREVCVGAESWWNTAYSFEKDVAILAAVLTDNNIPYSDEFRQHKNGGRQCRFKIGSTSK